MKNNANKMGTVKSKSMKNSHSKSGANKAGRKGFDVMGGAKAFAKTSKGRVKVTGTNKY